MSESTLKVVAVSNHKGFLHRFSQLIGNPTITVICKSGEDRRNVTINEFSNANLVVFFQPPNMDGLASGGLLDLANVAAKGGRNTLFVCCGEKPDRVDTSAQLLETNEKQALQDILPFADKHLNGRVFGIPKAMSA